MSLLSKIFFAIQVGITRIVKRHLKRFLSTLSQDYHCSKTQALTLRETQLELICLKQRIVRSRDYILRLTQKTV